eukprot:757436-Hanusia_phi.AAC.14
MVRSVRLRAVDTSKKKIAGGRKVEKDEGAMVRHGMAAGGTDSLQLSPIHRWWHEIPCDLKMFHLMKSLVRLRSKITENLSNVSERHDIHSVPEGVGTAAIAANIFPVSRLLGESEAADKESLTVMSLNSASLEEKTDGDDDCGWFSSLQQLSHHRSSRLSICHDSLCLISSSSPLLAPPPSRFYRFTRLILQEVCAASASVSERDLQLKHAFARHNESLIAEMQHVMPESAMPEKLTPGQREEQQEETVKQRKKEANRKKKEKEKERKARRSAVNKKLRVVMILAGEMLRLRRKKLRWKSSDIAFVRL